jgi:hypothetical protein
VQILAGFPRNLCAAGVLAFSPENARFGVLGALGVLVVRFQKETTKAPRTQRSPRINTGSPIFIGGGASMDA